MKIALLSVMLSVIASVITTRFLALRYFGVIDKYVKDLINDIHAIIRQATGNK